MAYTVQACAAALEEIQMRMPGLRVSSRLTRQTPYNNAVQVEEEESDDTSSCSNPKRKHETEWAEGEVSSSVPTNKRPHLARLLTPHRASCLLQEYSFSRHSRSASASHLLNDYLDESSRAGLDGSSLELLAKQSSMDACLLLHQSGHGSSATTPSGQPSEQDLASPNALPSRTLSTVSLGGIPSMSPLRSRDASAQGSPALGAGRRGGALMRTGSDATGLAAAAARGKSRPPRAHQGRMASATPERTAAHHGHTSPLSGSLRDESGLQGGTLKRAPSLPEEPDLAWTEDDEYDKQRSLPNEPVSKFYVKQGTVNPRRGVAFALQQQQQQQQPQQPQQQQLQQQRQLSGLLRQISIPSTPQELVDLSPELYSPKSLSALVPEARLTTKDLFTHGIVWSRGCESGPAFFVPEGEAQRQGGANEGLGGEEVQWGAADGMMMDTEGEYAQSKTEKWHDRISKATVRLAERTRSLPSDRRKRCPAPPAPTPSPSASPAPSAPSAPSAPCPEP